MMFYYLFQAFIASDITFAMKLYFRGTFCTLGVREGLVVGFLRHVNSVCQVTRLINPEKTRNSETGTLMNSEEAEFHQGLHCLLRQNRSSEKEI